MCVADGLQQPASGAVQLCRVSTALPRGGTALPRGSTALQGWFSTAGLVQYQSIPSIDDIVTGIISGMSASLSSSATSPYV